MTREEERCGVSRKIWLAKKAKKKRVVDDTHKRGEIFFCRQFRYNSQSYTSQVLKTLKKSCSKQTFGHSKNGLVSGRLACTSSNSQKLRVRPT